MLAVDEYKKISPNGAHWYHQPKDTSATFPAASLGKTSSRYEQHRCHAPRVSHSYSSSFTLQFGPSDMSRAASCDRRMHVTVNFRHASPRKSRKKLTETTHTSYEYEPCVNTSIVQFPLLEVLLLAKYQLHFFFRRPPQQKYLI